MWTNYLVFRLLEKCPNVYACTKAVSEFMLKKEGSDIPLAIIRPSIVTAASEEPIPGWIDNLNGPTGVIAGVAKGILRTIYANPDVVADLIPVDFVVNLMIVSAYYTAEHHKSLIIFNCCTGQLKPLTWGQFRDHFFDCGFQNPVKSLIWYPSISMDRSLYVHRLKVICYHYLPAYFIDAATSITGSKFKLVILCWWLV